MNVSAVRSSPMVLAMKPACQPRPHALQPSLVAALLLAALLAPAAAQDIRGLEVCTAERQMDRRTACLQANVEFLQQALLKLAHDTQDRLAASERDLAAARAEIATLKSALDKLGAELAQVKAAKAETPAKK
jgi:septal ring factor EnvC (AmiA/AmiB activator)